MFCLICLGVKITLLGVYNKDKNPAPKKYSLKNLDKRQNSHGIKNRLRGG
jgi:hypothetical protein